MKIMTLNTWGGKLCLDLIKFLIKQRDIDAFCFQEVYDTESGVTESNGARMDLFHQLQEALPYHHGRFAAVDSNFDYNGPVDFPVSYGLALFVRKTLTVAFYDDPVVYENNQNTDFRTGHSVAGKIQIVTIVEKNIPYSIINARGIWNDGHKIDTDARIRQSQSIVAEISKRAGHRILAGDLNLLPDTESMRLLEEVPLRNLIRESGATSTRSSYYQGEQKYADYILVSPGLDVTAFQIFDVEVSDHVPLVVEFF